MALSPTFRVEQLFTDDDINKMLYLYREGSPAVFAQMCADNIIEPVLQRIQGVVGREVDPLYVAYMMQHILDQKVVR